MHQHTNVVVASVFGIAILGLQPHTGHAADVALPGKTLTIANKVPDNPEKNKAIWIVKDAAVVAGLPTTADDPTCIADGGSGAGGTIRFFSDGSGGSTQDTANLPLPCENWKATRSGYKYRDKEQNEGPCSLVFVRTGKLLKARCSGKNPGNPFNYDLMVEVDEGIVGTVLTVGTIRYCTAFDGHQDADGRDGRKFKGKNAPAPGACPATTTTTVTTTTTTTLPFVPTCSQDPSRTIFAGLPGTAACQQFSDDQSSCESAFHFGACGFASCFFDVSSGDCLGCGANNRSQGLCINTCNEGPQPSCPGDPSRDVFAGFSGTGACTFLSFSQTLCERAFHIGGTGIPSPCFFDTDNEECLGCGPNNQESGLCANTCPVCPGDTSRTIHAGGPGTQACQQFSNDQVLCERAFHSTSEQTSASCFFDSDTGDCLGCGPNNQANELCSNSCALCAGDSSRTVFVGGPGTGACGLLEDNPVLCEQAFHVGACGNATPCFFDTDAGSCLGCGPNNQLQGLCADSCPGPLPPVPPTEPPPGSPSGAFLIVEGGALD